MHKVKANSAFSPCYQVLRKNVIWISLEQVNAKKMVQKNPQHPVDPHASVQTDYPISALSWRVEPQLLTSHPALTTPHSPAHL